MHVHHCLHTRACRDMSQVVKMSGWRWLGPAPRMHEWRSTETIVLSSDTGAIFRAWKRVGFENVAASVCRDALEGKEKSEDQLGGETMSFMLTFPVETFEDMHHFIASSNNFVHLCDIVPVSEKASMSSRLRYVKESRKHARISGYIHPSKNQIWRLSWCFCRRSERQQRSQRLHVLHKGHILLERKIKCRINVSTVKVWFTFVVVTFHKYLFPLPFSGKAAAGSLYF